MGKISISFISITLVVRAMLGFSLGTLAVVVTFASLFGIELTQFSKDIVAIFGASLGIVVAIKTTSIHSRQVPK